MRYLLTIFSLLILTNIPNPMAFANDSRESQVTEESQVNSMEVKKQKRLERSKKMEKFNGLIWIFLIVIIVAIFGVVSIYSYNSLVSKSEAMEEQWSQVKVVLQRRLDLIPQLVSTVKAGATHEEKIFEQITQSRKALAEALENSSAKSQDLSQLAKEEQTLKSQVLRVIAITENNPALRANESFLVLLDQLEGSENRVSLERQRFNVAVKEYNSTLKKFPGNIVNTFIGLEESEYFESDVGAGEAPKLGF